MSQNGPVTSLPPELVENKIYLIRGKKIMLDRDLATLYGVETRILIQAARRNIGRFPEDFMFKLNTAEEENLRSQFVISSWGGRRYLPYVFTEQGVAMISSVLKSERAIQVNIQIMRTFTKIRQMLAGNSELRTKVEALEKKYDGNFKVIFEAIRKMLEVPNPPKSDMGFRLK